MKVKKSTKLLFCIAFASILTCTDQVSAKQIKSATQAQELALQKVKNATVIDVESDQEDGVKVYELTLVKGSKKYEITYRASDGKMLDYGWEKRNVNPATNKTMISRSKCESLAKKQVKNGEIISLTQKSDDGIDIYKVKMTAGTKKYTLKYHARTGALIEYDWELIASTSSGKEETYIGTEKAQKVALAKVPGATVVKAKFEIDDGIPVYEVELIKGRYEYEYKIHAQTGNIVEYEKDLID